MAAYTRRQILLKREDGAPAGFLRMERAGNRCEVEVQVDAKHKELPALLLDGEQVLPLGRITRNRAMHAPRIDDMFQYDRAAILSGDRLLFVGGENADFAIIQRILQKQKVAAREIKETIAMQDDLQAHDSEMERARTYLSNTDRVNVRHEEPDRTGLPYDQADRLSSWYDDLEYATQYADVDYTDDRCNEPEYMRTQHKQADHSSTPLDEQDQMRPQNNQTDRSNARYDEPEYASTQRLAEDRVSIQHLKAEGADTPPADARRTKENHSISALSDDLPSDSYKQKDGWSFAPCHVGVFQCYEGRLMRDGRATAKMHALAGVYGPEPPPGLAGFVWDSGYWVKVETAEPISRFD